MEIVTILGLPIAAVIWKLRHSRHAEAQDTVPQPVDIRLDLFADRAVEHRSDRAKPVTHRPRTAHALYRTRNWLALESDHSVLVIPARAFPGKDAMTALSARWDAQRA